MCATVQAKIPGRVIFNFWTTIIIILIIIIIIIIITKTHVCEHIIPDFAYIKQARTTKHRQITRQKLTTRQAQTTKHGQMAMELVDIDALVTFIKVWGSESTG